MALTVVWFLAAAVAHDLLLFPLYAVADAAAVRVTRYRRAGSVSAVRWVNHVRVPAVVSGTLLVVWLPLILGLPSGYSGITGYSTDPYLPRWLLVTAGLFALSAGTYAVRLRRARRAGARWREEATMTAGKLDTRSVGESRSESGADPQP